MKTAMQEAIKEIAELWGSPSDKPTYSQIFKVLEDKLEKEKEQIEETFDNGFYHALYCRADETQLDGEDYYNEKYNQNK